MAGVSAPLQACEHFYIVTEPIADLPRGLPVLRVPDEQTYYKEDAGKLLIGCFELEAKPWALEGIPEAFCFDQLPPDIDHFAPILDRAIKRVPLLERAGIHTFFNGPESFTPDDRYLLGEAPEVKNFWLACGFNSIGIQSAGGAGKALAEWMQAGEPTMGDPHSNTPLSFTGEGSRASARRVRASSKSRANAQLLTRLGFCRHHPLPAKGEGLFLTVSTRPRACEEIRGV